MAREKRKKRTFKGAVSRNAAKQQRGNQYGYLNLPKGIPVFREEPGRVDLDIIPYVVTGDYHPDRDEEWKIALKGDLWYKRPFYLHRNIGPENKAVVCPSSIGKPCPICEYRAEMLKKEGVKWDDPSVRDLKPGLRNLYFVIPRGHKKFDAEVHIWDISQYCFQDSLNEEIQENEEYETFPDLEEGKTLRIRFSEEKLGSNTFSKTSRIDFHDRKPIKESILDDLPSLDDVLDVMTYKQLEQLFYGGILSDDSDDSDDEDEEKLSRTKSRKPSSPPDDDEDDDEEPEDDFDSDEFLDDDDFDSDEFSDDDDEDGDGDDDEEEEEEDSSPPPKRSSKSGSSKKNSEKESIQRRKGTSKSDNSCPHGYTFGEDFEAYDDCDQCKHWDLCYDAHAEIQQELYEKESKKDKSKKRKK